MELSTDLIVKIIVLLTAIVGLFKVANTKLAEPFLVQLFAAMSLLVLPVMLLAFLWIMTTLTSVTKIRKEPVDWTASDAEIMYAITREFWDQSQRQEALKLTIEHAFKTRQWAVVVKASEDLNPTGQRTDVLMRAIKMLAGANPPTKKTD